jgi:hypothetical protein
MFGRIIVATDLQASTRMSLRAACDLVHSEWRFRVQLQRDRGVEICP